MVKEIDEALLKRLMEYAEGRRLMEYLAQTVLTLDSLEDITQDDPVEIAIEVKARRLAGQKLRTALRMLLRAAEEAPGGIDPQEFVV